MYPLLIVTCHRVIVTFGFPPSGVVNLLYPAVAIPARGYLDERVASHATAFQCSQIVERKRGRQLVEYRVVAAVANALRLCVGVLILQYVTERLYLLIHSILSHHHCKLGACFRLFGKSAQQVEYHSAAETYDSGSAAVYIFNVVRWKHRRRWWQR